MKEVELDIAVNADTAIYWQDDTLYLLDQRVLPRREVFIECKDAGETAEAIRSMVVRGAPAIGITAAYGIAMAARRRLDEAPEDWRQLIEQDLQRLAASRPDSGKPVLGDRPFSLADC